MQQTEKLCLVKEITLLQSVQVILLFLYDPWATSWIKVGTFNGETEIPRSF